jgi:hypothetical protein
MQTWILHLRRVRSRANLRFERATREPLPGRLAQKGVELTDQVRLIGKPGTRGSPCPTDRGMKHLERAVDPQDPQETDHARN